MYANVILNVTSVLRVRIKIYYIGSHVNENEKQMVKI